MSDTGLPPAARLVAAPSMRGAARSGSARSEPPGTERPIHGRAKPARSAVGQKR